MTNIETKKNPFEDERLCGARAVMVKMNPDPQGRYAFELWTQYTRQGLNSLQVGDLVAVENYTTPSKDGGKTYSILTLTQVYPTHFATQGPDAYPGHVFESMRSVKEDWEKQSDKPLHLTTTIVAEAVSTGWQFTYNPKEQNLPLLEEERNLPMTGAELRPLSMGMVDAIINQGLEQQPDSPFIHRRFEGLRIKIHEEALLTTHFGIFGFTGVGKSNLVSSLVTALSAGESRRSNVVLIDPNDEYIGLLIDRFVSNPEEMRYIHVGPDSLPLPVIKILGKDVKDVPSEVIDLLYRQMKLPSRLKNNKEIESLIKEGLRNVLARTAIVIPALDLASLIHNEIFEQTDPRSGPAVLDVLRQMETAWIKAIEDSKLTGITSDSLKKAIEIPEQFNSKVTAPINNLKDSTKQATVQGVLKRTIGTLERNKRALEEIPSKAIASVENLKQGLNDQKKRQTMIVTARRDSDLKLFSAILGNDLYESRRREAILEPYTIFLFDEADLFIPLESEGEGAREIKDLCITLARRGRKFGLGIGISTQRAALLNTEVMGNLHTYFVSKLPRSLDRQRVTEAFGIGEEQLSPTFSFRPGNWLIISHDATGLKGVPIPTIADDANERILQAAKGKSK